MPQAHKQQSRALQKVRHRTRPGLRESLKSALLRRPDLRQASQAKVGLNSRSFVLY